MNNFLYSRNKRYLTGMDWIAQVFDHDSRKKTGSGHVSQIVLEMDGSLDAGDFAEKIKLYTSAFTVLNGSSARDITLAPYWKISRKKIKSVDVRAHEHTDIAFNENEAIRILSENLNIPFASKGEYLSFCLILYRDRSYVSMKFDHRLFDARGAEMFFSLMMSMIDNGYKDPGQTPFRLSPEPPHLDNWKEKFEAGKTVNRTFKALANDAAPGHFQVNGRKNGLHCKFRILKISAGETEDIINMANTRAGYFMMTPYCVHLLAPILDDFLSYKTEWQSDLMIPVSIDMRKSMKSEKKIFFNYMSFLFFKISRETGLRSEENMASLREQMYTQIKSRFPEALCSASMLMRILPRAVFSKLMNIPFKGSIASFSFSMLMDTACKNNNFMGHEILNMFHMPKVPPSPGVGIFINIFNGKMNLILSFLDPVFRDKEADDVMDRIDRALRADNYEK